MKSFIQKIGGTSTLDSFREILIGNNYSCFAAFSYITDSGVALIESSLSEVLSERENNRWLISFDYGRSQPSAIRRLAGLGNNQIRVHDGISVVEAEGFRPRISFHMKTAVTLSPAGTPCKQLVGSGNLSASGLTCGIEAGCILDYTLTDVDGVAELIDTLEELWRQATPVEELIDLYEENYSRFSQPILRPQQGDALDNEPSIFWIDVGYVTRNRGPDRPGNQFDLPRGAHIYLGLHRVENPQLNSNLGLIKISAINGEVIERNLRFGNNSMEKLTLPLPEQFGYGAYDGKILTFDVVGDEVKLDAFEHEDFFRIYGDCINSVHEMNSGRRYGTAQKP